MSTILIDKNVQVPNPRKITTKPRRSDQIFRSIMTFGGLTAFIVLAIIALYLFTRSTPVLREFGWHFVSGSIWNSGDGFPASKGSESPAQFGLFPMLYGSFLIAVIAMFIAVPISVSIAIGIVFYLPKRISNIVTFFVDLSASIPSVIFGLWGLFVLSPHAAYWAKLLKKYLHAIPIFSVDFPSFDQSPFVAGLVLALMITPIVTSVSREIFSQTPIELVQGAYSLGANKSSMIRMVAIPFGRGGIIGGAMLGLGRALGETIAVFYVLQLVYDKTNFFQILESKGGSVASLIVARYGEASEFEISALFGAGLVLFLLTLAANFVAAGIVTRTLRSNKKKK